jgi:hypothetical protein
MPDRSNVDGPAQTHFEPGGKQGGFGLTDGCRGRLRQGSIQGQYLQVFLVMIGEQGIQDDRDAG